MTKSEAYKKGVMIGGAVGFIGAVALNKRVLLWTAIFAIGSGYLAYSLVENVETAPKFVNKDKENI